MTPVFIFADYVKKVLESGQKEIELPEGARISAAAYDIVRDNKIRITYVPPENLTADDDGPTAAERPAEAEVSPQVRESSAAGNIASEPSRDSAGEIPPELLEDIVDRVIERVKQLKGLEPAASAADTGAASEPEAEAVPDDDLVICRCEEITRGEIKDAIRNGMRTLNGIKRVTRAGMGLCQGQTCQLLVARILTEELGLTAAEIDPTTARGPVRPLRLEVFANS